MGEDNFNRSIVFVFVDGKNVNQVLLNEGLVRYDGSPSPYRDQLRESYQSAMAMKLGIFGTCRETESPKKNCQIKGNIDKQQTSTKIYYFPGCSAYAQTVVERDRGEEWFCSEASAEAAGYVKSKNCFGRSYQ